MPSCRALVRRDEGVVILTVRKSAFLQFAIYLIMYLLEYVITSPAPGYRKVCLGTDSGINHGHSGQPWERYEMYRKMYTNCTYIDGNLEIVFLEGGDYYDMSFLKDIQEVTGYVLILSNSVEYIPLTSLRIIRGRTLYSDRKDDTGDHHNSYSLFVAYNYKPGSATIGLKELRFSSLHEIMDGNVLFLNNNLLCYENTINWKDILTGENSEVIHHRNSKDFTRDCDQCHENCTNGKDRNCWGAGPDMCQTLTKLSCSPQCDSRCFGPNPSQCCHSDCAGGCSGPTRYDCWACKSFINENRCEAYCPTEFIYDPRTYKKVPNPNAKFSYGSICVEKCPSHLIADRGACVSDCGFGHIAGPEGKCIECDGPCPKTCPGNGAKEFVNAHNLNNFTDCTVIQGRIRILQTTFTGDEYKKIPPIVPDQLKVFETVQEITDFLQIQADAEGFQNLSFFKNLRFIHGRVLDNMGASFHIYSTSLRSLGLQSLESIRNGMVFIQSNPHLCYVNTINWRSVLSLAEQKVSVTVNRNATQCAMDGDVCSSECTSDGCWGDGNDQCLSCANYRFESRCVPSCDFQVYALDVNGTKECKRCHEECLGNCHGSNADQCESCGHTKDGPYCVAECPVLKYPDSNNSCQPCHVNCKNGCSGPLNTIGANACRSCDLIRFDEDHNIQHCMMPEDECGVGYYKGFIPSNRKIKVNGKTITSSNLVESKGCMRCHQECLACTGPDLFHCTLCAHFKEEGKCVSNCSADFYHDSSNVSEAKCLPCDQRCVHCTGPTEANCLACKHFKIYRDTVGHNSSVPFNCTDKCPESAPHKTADLISRDPGMICVLDPPSALSDHPQSGLVVGVVAGCLILIGIIILPIVYMRRQWARAEENKLRLTARMSGLEESEPLTPSDAKPDMAMLRLIKESEIRRGNIIGSGAFGTVYKGVWVPEGENVKIPVAIKVLQDGTSASQNKELLEEARIMTSVVHPCCIRILAVCMTVQMMLVTQLMPLGCLLDYVRRNKANICSKVMLNWSTQIARGMIYLEKRGIVHRDLAARNVLVQSPNQVKITDFGLAKLLDYNEDEFHAVSGKMPIKWLALECIQHRVFTHKSDVWSFGVTVWEIFTYGQRPYESVHAKDIADLLEKGERLSQPSICTIDVYMIMIKCWMLDAMSRPSFKELAEEFAKMARDPGRYLVIPGDKLMRLPSQTYDTADLVRNMSIPADGPEEVVTAEEYLHPQGNNVCIDHMTSIKYHINGALEMAQEGGHVEGRNGGRKSRLRQDDASDQCFYRQWHDAKFSCLEPAPTKSKPRQNHEVLSCTSEPPSTVSTLIECDPDSRQTISSDHALPFASDGDGGQKLEKVKMRLPVDEDDYLQPKLSKPNVYLELVNNESNADSVANDGNQSASSPQERPQHRGCQIPPHSQPPLHHCHTSTGATKKICPGSSPEPVSTGAVVENPEYFDGVHLIFGCNNSRGAVLFSSCDSRTLEMRPLRLRSQSTESEAASNGSDLDFCSECDRLNQQKKRTGVQSQDTSESSV